MPIYEYVCEKCEHEFEHLAKSMSAMSEKSDKVECPKCHSTKTGRKLSVVAISAGAKPSAGGGGHVHSGTCGCGKMRGSCGSGL